MLAKYLKQKLIPQLVPSQPLEQIPIIGNMHGSLVITKTSVGNMEHKENSSVLPKKEQPQRIYLLLTFRLIPLVGAT